VSAFTAAPSSQRPQASAPILGLQIRCPCAPCGQPASVEAAVIDSFQPLFIIHFCLALRVPLVGPVSISSRGGLLGILITVFKPHGISALGSYVGQRFFFVVRTGSASVSFALVTVATVMLASVFQSILSSLTTVKFRFQFPTFIDGRAI
jgi:hypothetical protein